MSWDLLYALDLIALMSFVVSYYFNCYRRGYRIDIWHVQLFLMCVLPNMLLLPFSKGELNYPVLGSDFPAVVASLPTVFLITLLGYFSLLGGGFFWHIRTGLGIRRLTMRLLDLVPECSMMVMSSPTTLVFQTWICVLLQAMILGYYFSKSGFGFDLRQFTFANPALRPVALLISTYSVFIGSHCFARYIEKKTEAADLRSASEPRANLFRRERLCNRCLSWRPGVLSDSAPESNKSVQNLQHCLFAAFHRTLSRKCP